MNRVDIKCADTSVRGPVRELNEDYAHVTPVMAQDEGGSVEGLLAIVADGMGGHDAGDVASRTAAETFIAHVEQALAEPGTCSSPVDALREAMEAANRAVYDYSVEAESARGMGTTLTAVLILNRVAWICHVGDTRAYLVSGGRVRQLTTDDSLVQSKVDRGIISDQEARRSTQRNVLLQAVGTGETIEPEIGKLDLPADFRLLLASDGAHGALQDSDILEAMLTSDSPQAACDDLIERAAARDGSDNLSAIALWGPEKPPQTVIIPPERSARSPAKWLFVGVLAVAAALAIWIWGPMGVMPGAGTEEPSPPDLWAVADEIADADRLLVLEIELGGGVARVRYRSPQQPLRFTIGNSGKLEFEPTGAEDSAELTIDDIPMLQAPEGEAAGAEWPDTPLVFLVNARDDDGGRWHLSRSANANLDDYHRGVWIDGVHMRDEDHTDMIETGPLEHWPTEDIKLFAPGPEVVPITFWMRDTSEERIEETAGAAESRQPGLGSSPRPPSPAPHSPRRVSAPPSPASAPPPGRDVTASHTRAVVSQPTERAENQGRPERHEPASGDDSEPPATPQERQDTTPPEAENVQDDSESAAADDDARGGAAQQTPAPSSEASGTDGGRSAPADETPESRRAPADAATGAMSTSSGSAGDDEADSGAGSGAPEAPDGEDDSQ